MLFKRCQPVLPNSLHYLDSLVLPMLHTVNDLKAEALVPTLGKVSAKWGTLVLDLPPVSCVSLVHCFCSLANVL